MMVKLHNRDKEWGVHNKAVIKKPTTSPRRRNGDPLQSCVAQL